MLRSSSTRCVPTCNLQDNSGQCHPATWRQIAHFLSQLSYECQVAQLFQMCANLQLRGRLHKLLLRGKLHTFWVNTIPDESLCVQPPWDSEEIPLNSMHPARVCTRTLRFRRP